MTTGEVSARKPGGAGSETRRSKATRKQLCRSYSEKA